MAVRPGIHFPFFSFTHGLYNRYHYYIVNRQKSGIIYVLILILWLSDIFFLFFL